MIKKIDYPVENILVCLMGKPADWQRKFTVVPVFSGSYMMVVWPKKFVLLHTVMMQSFDYLGGNVAPVELLFEIEKKHRSIEEWQWKLVQIDETLKQIQERELFMSNVLFDKQSAAEGTFRLYETEFKQQHNLIVWSCNQPFETADSGELILHDVALESMKWYKQQVLEFTPSLIWGLGDTAYADGTEASDFINNYYDHPGVIQSENGQKELQKQYREMYTGHWKFSDLQFVMRNYPHLTIWDDHEIRDGWGSEANDFEKGNANIQRIARGVAKEFILNQGPLVRDTKQFPDSDTHQMYIEGNVASFVFDGRSSRHYYKEKGHVISEEQFTDFEAFCEYVAEHKKEVKFILMGSGVPFINLQDYIETLGSKAPKVITDLMAGIRDDVRDSWASPGNIEGLKRLIGILRKLMLKRPELEIVNISGDIHVANAFTFQPLGFAKPLFQITTSALTNREHPPELLASLIYLDETAFSETLGIINRVWTEVSDPNILLVENRGNILRMHLKVFDLELKEGESRTLSSAKDKVVNIGQYHREFLF